jgi:hypothetical protein
VGVPAAGLANRHAALVEGRQRGQDHRPQPWVGMKTVSKFFGFSKTIFDFSRPDLAVTVFSKIGIDFRNFTPESVSKSVQPSADRFPRLPILIEIFRILVSEFSEK